jgi:glycosyltransferase involved in cell wall biosynthesis
MTELSVIIPSYNRRNILRRCLDALAQQTLPCEDFEVVVVDDGSSDGTDRMLAEAQFPFRLRAIRQENSGQAAALNRGIACAHGTYCLFLDDDITASPQLLEEHLRLQRSMPEAVGIGQILLDIPETADWFTVSFAVGWREQYDGLARSDTPPSWSDCYSGNMSVRHDRVHEVGGFSTDVPRGFDVELAFRLAKIGLTFHYLPNAVGTQHEQKNAQQLAADAENAGAAFRTLVRRHPAMLRDLARWYGNSSPRYAVLRAVLLALNVGSSSLLWLGSCRWLGPRVRRRGGFIHGYLFWRGVRNSLDHASWSTLTSQSVILMYHGFGDSDEAASRYVLPVRQFRRQMALLRLLRYRVVGLNEYVSQLQRGTHRRLVVLTIDDGYDDAYSRAFPVLVRFGYPATIFLVSGKIGASNDWDVESEVSNRRIVSREEIQEMRRHGIEFGAHTRTHRMLTMLSEMEAREEIQGSVADLEREFGSPVRTFAYPYGEFAGEHEKIVAGSEIAAGCGVDAGFNTIGTPVTGLRRIEVYGTDSITRFLLKLWFGWVGRPPASQESAADGTPEARIGSTVSE